MAWFVSRVIAGAAFCDSFSATFGAGIFFPDNEMNKYSFFSFDENNYCIYFPFLNYK